MKEKILKRISDYANSETVDNLILETDEAKISYTSSKPNLYVIFNNKAYINKAYQSHQQQTVKVNIQINYKNGLKSKLEKNILVSPIVYKTLNKNPVATYFFTGAMPYYKKHSKHYNIAKNIFTNTIKEHLDILYYSFVKPQNDGSLIINEKKYLDEVRKLKKYNTRVLFTIDGVSKETSDTFKKVTSTKKKIKNFTKNILDLVDLYKFDGVDIDWEPFTGGIIPSQLENLITSLKEEMNKRQAKGGSPYLLTMAVPGGVNVLKEGSFDLNKLSVDLDYINFMTYDLNNNNVTSHLTPVGNNGIKRLLRYLKKINFPLNKAIVGSGAYGKAYKILKKYKNPLNKKASLIQLKEYEDLGAFKSGTLYIQAIEEIKKNKNYTIIHDYDQENNLIGSYLYNKDKNIFITYESELSAQNKMKLIKNYPNMGIMTWAYTQDASNHILNTLIEQRERKD